MNATELRQNCLKINRQSLNRHFHVEYRAFAQRIWEAFKELEKREGKPVSQSELARRIEERGGHRTRQDDVSRWFREVSRPDYEELPTIANVLGVNLMWLTFGIGPMAAPSKGEGDDELDPIIPMGERRGIVQKSVKDEIAARQNPRKPKKRKGA